MAAAAAGDRALALGFGLPPLPLLPLPTATGGIVLVIDIADDPGGSNDAAATVPVALGLAWL